MILARLRDRCSCFFFSYERSAGLSSLCFHCSCSACSAELSSLCLALLHCSSRLCGIVLRSVWSLSSRSPAEALLKAHNLSELRGTAVSFREVNLLNRVGNRVGSASRALPDYPPTNISYLTVASSKCSSVQPQVDVKRGFIAHTSLIKAERVRYASCLPTLPPNRTISVISATGAVGVP